MARIGFPIGPVIDRLAQEYAVHPTDGRLTVHAVASRAVAHSDPTLVEQILRNLIENRQDETVEILRSWLEGEEEKV